MSLYLLLLAFQAEAPLDPPPLKVRPVTVTNPSPTASPTIIYTPAKPEPALAPAASSEITYVPAKPASDPAAASPLAELSDSARQRLAQEKQADTERRLELRREMIAAQTAIGRALAATPLDMTALKAALERRDQVMASSRSKVTDAVIDLLGDIAPGERLVVARALIESDSPRAAQQAPQTETKTKPSPVGR